MLNDKVAEICLQHFPSRDRFEVWRSVFRPLYSVSLPDGIEPGSFEGEMSVAALADCCILTCSSGPQVLARDAAALKLTRWDHVALQLNESGTIVGDTLTARQGDIHLLDLSRTFLMRARRFDHITLIAPRDRVVGRRTRPGHGQALAGPGAMRDIVARHLRAIALNAIDLTAPEAAHVLDALFLMIARADCGAWDPQAQASACASLRDTVCAYIDRHLGDCRLDPARIAAACHMSRATLYRLFADEDGVAAFLCRRRLDLAFTLIARPRATSIRISTVAHRCGFKSDVHFSRAFKAHFGLTPREIRDGATPAIDEVTRSPDAWVQAMRRYRDDFSTRGITASKRDSEPDWLLPGFRSCG